MDNFFLNKGFAIWRTGDGQKQNGSIVKKIDLKLKKLHNVKL
jgi:hypothetical protein